MLQAYVLQLQVGVKNTHNQKYAKHYNQDEYLKNERKEKMNSMYKLARTTTSCIKHSFIQETLESLSMKLSKWKWQLRKTPCDPLRSRMSLYIMNMMFYLLIQPKKFLGREEPFCIPC